MKTSIPPNGPGVLIVLFSNRTFDWFPTNFSRTCKRAVYIGCMFAALFFSGLLVSDRSVAQTCNAPDTLNTANHNGVTENSGATGLLASVSNPNNVIGATSSSATLNSIVLGNAYIGVTKASPATKYAAGTFAGFNVTNTTLLGLLSNITISTYSGGTLQESVTGSSILISSGLLSGNNNYDIGFKTTKSFDNIRITLGGVLASLDVYYAFVESFCAGPSLSCNTLTTIAAPSFPVTVDPSQTGLLGVGSVSNADNVIDANTGNYASITTTAGVATGGSIAVKDNVTTYPAGTFAAFDIASSSLLGINLLGNVTVSTYKAGILQESIAGSSLLTVNPSLLSASNGRTIAGFKTSHDFDEVKIAVSNTLGLAYTVNVYGLLLENFCVGTPLSCNTLTAAVSPDLPVYVDGANTGINNIATVGGSLNNALNVIDSDLTNYADIALTAGVAATASFAVADALNTYPANSFAGFDIQTNTQLLTAAVLSNATVYLYNNGTLVQTGTGNALLIGTTSSLLANGTTRQVVGIVANVTYNEVKISFNQLVSASLGDIRIYAAVFEKTCPPVIACSATYYLNNPSFPTVIDNALTGVSGVATVDASVADPWNVISASTTDYARISNNATVLANASIAVLDPITTYPKGTFAGFVIKPGSTPAVLANLLNAITVSTYNNGVLRESHVGSSSLISLTVLATLIGTPATGSYNIGFYTAQPFDEIRITVGSLLNAGLLNNSYIDVYGAFIDTRSSVSGTGTLTCMQANPDVNAGLVNVIVPGNVSTNDMIPGGATYNTPAGPVSAPAGSTATFVVNADGSYTFKADKAGVYTYNVPYCLAGMTTGCASEPLTITLTDPAVNTNSPVANTDLAVTVAGTPVTVNVRANDGPGNAGGVLGVPTITIPPGNGTAVVNGSGNVVYTPAAAFVGNDTLTYQVCESPSGKCATAQVFITVTANGSAATVAATDDYASTLGTTPVTGNVLTNDISSAGNALTATVQNRTIAGKGAIVLNSNGSYTFTPATGFYGTVDIPYTAKDLTGGDSASATLHIVVNPFQPNPDINDGLVNQTIPGNVHTNDVVPVGTAYGTPVPVLVPSGSNPVITMNADGSYTFTADKPGVYSYNVPYCIPGAASPCPVQPLVITLTDPGSTTNAPIANNDIITTTAGTPVAIKVEANDGPGNPGGTLGVPVVTVNPSHGTVSVNADSTITYTPAPGYSGTDVFTYQVCESPGGLCAAATVTVTVNAAGTPAAVSAADDYAHTTGTLPASGNVLTNDASTAGNKLTAAAQNITLPEGTLVLNSDGSYVFTPVSGFTGTVNIPYTANDTVSNASANATLHVVVGNVPDLTPTISFLPAVTNGITNVNILLSVYEFNGVNTDGLISVYVLKDPKYVLSFNPSASTLAGNPVSNSVWTFDALSNPLYYILTTSSTVPGYGVLSAGFTTTFNPHSATGATVISAIILSGSGGETDDSDNGDDDTLIYK